jgi:cation-transporting ATPase 13A3/4/5
MLSIIVLTIFSTFVLLAPPSALARLLDIKPLPPSSRVTLLVAAALNAVLCGALERWAPLARIITSISRQFKTGKRRGVREGKLYKAVEGGMR